MEHIENYNHFLGQIGRPSLETLPPDAEVHIIQGVFVPNDPPGSYPVNNLAHYKGTLLSVHFIGEDWSTVEGSAVMVAPGVALTAAHTFEPPIMTRIIEGKLGVVCVGLTPTGLRGWQIRRATRVDGTDLMLLALDYASPFPADGQFTQAVMSTRLPQIGETLMIAGFRASDDYVPGAKLSDFPFKDGSLLYGVNVRIGVGKVTQHFLKGRGSAAPGPILEVDCATPGGLSGGPAFDRDGALVGVLCRSINYEDGAGHSYVSLLVPALVIDIEPKFLNLYSGAVTLLDLHPKVCGIQGRETIATLRDEERGEVLLEISGW